MFLPHPDAKQGQEALQQETLACHKGIGQMAALMVKSARAASPVVHGGRQANHAQVQTKWLYNLLTAYSILLTAYSKEGRLLKRLCIRYCLLLVLLIYQRSASRAREH